MKNPSSDYMQHIGTRKEHLGQDLIFQEGTMPRQAWDTQGITASQ